MRVIRTVGRFPPKVMRGCLGKMRHASQGKADAHMRALKRSGDEHDLRSYFCVRCKHWHVGHVADRRADR